MSKENLKIGFVGLGKMGFPMAKNLCEAGFDVLVSDVDTDAVEKLCKETSAKAAESLTDLGCSCNVVITMLPNSQIVRKVLVEDGGVIHSSTRVSIVIDMSSSSPTGTKVLAKELSSKEV